MDKWASTPEEGSLRGRAIKAGRYLLARQVLTLFVSTASILIVTRCAGPAVYGAFIAALTIWFFHQTVFEFGLDVWLVRREHVTDSAAFRTAHSLLAITGVLGVATCFAVSGFVAEAMRSPSVATALHLTAPCLLIANLSQVPLSLLERRLEMAKVGAIESVGQVLWSGIMIVSALTGGGIVGLSLAFLCQQVFLALGYYLAAGTLIGFGWDNVMLRKALAFGLPTTANAVVGAVPGLITPILIGRYAGPDAVGYYSLARRMLDQGTFIKQVIVRMSYALFGRTRSDTGRAQRAFGDALIWQSVGIGFPAAAIGGLANWLLAPILGEAWVPAFRYFAILCPTYLIFAQAQLLQSFLLSRDMTGRLLAATVAYCATFSALVMVLTQHFDIAGLALAEGCASMAFGIGVFAVRKFFVTKQTLAWVTVIAAVAVGVQGVHASPIFYFAYLAPLTVPACRRELARATRDLAGRRKPSDKAVAP